MNEETYMNKKGEEVTEYSPSLVGMPAESCKECNGLTLGCMVAYSPQEARVCTMKDDEEYQEYLKSMLEATRHDDTPPAD